MVIWQVFSLTEVVYNDTSLLKRQPESKEEGSIEKTKFKPYIPSCFEIKSTNRRNLNKTSLLYAMYDRYWSGLVSYESSSCNLNFES